MCLVLDANTTPCPYQAIDAQCFQDISRTAWEATHSISNLSITPHVLVNALLKRFGTHATQGASMSTGDAGGFENGQQVMDEHAWFTFAEEVCNDGVGWVGRF